MPGKQHRAGKHNPAALLQGIWQPALSIAAIVLSITSYIEAKRANDLAQTQFETSEKNRLQAEAEAKRQARQVVLSEISDDGRSIAFSIPAEDVSLRSLYIEFPPELKIDPVWTESGRRQAIEMDALESGLRNLFLPPDHGPIVTEDVLAFIPVAVNATLGGRGESYGEMSTYWMQVRSSLVNGKPELKFESFEMDTPLTSDLSLEDSKAMLSRCWRAVERGAGRHDANRSPADVSDQFGCPRGK